MMMFYRNHLKYLIKWKSSPQRRPLILRGARQVGKTYLVRDFAKKEFSQFIEVNFDHPTIKDLIPLFESTSPKDLIPLLEIHFRTKIIAGQTLLFFDEIQNAPKLIPMLRYFYEDFPELHVIAAGSLLEFVLATHEFSMPIGRIEYLHLAQMTFPEFLLAIDEKPIQKRQILRHVLKSSRISYQPIRTTFTNITKGLIRTDYAIFFQNCR